MMGNIETRNYMAEEGSVKSSAIRTEPWQTPQGIQKAITKFNLLSVVCEIRFDAHQDSAIYAKPITEAFKKNVVVNSIKCC